jgi:phosphatidylinositol-3-phosphatase
MDFLRARLLARIAALVTLLATSVTAVAAPTGARHPPIGHVFVIVLENKDYEVTFGPNSPAPYLAKSLPRQGVLLQEYYGTGHFSLSNYLAMLSGQAATPETRSDCETYADFNLKGMTEDGQAIGRGCVYPATIRTLPDQLDEVARTWRAYLEDMGNDASREGATCGHPPLDGVDRTQEAEAPSADVPAGDQYASRHNPFVYFHSIIDSPRCATNVVPLDWLRRDLRNERTTPGFVFIAPNLCNDGHDSPCKNGQAGGLVSIDAFLRKWVPRILASPAYRRDGLLVVTFDEGDAEVRKEGVRHVMRFPGKYCCHQQPGPNLGPYPHTEEEGDWTYRFDDYGGDRIGAVLLSPFLSPGTIASTPFNHYSLLRTVEDLFGTRGHLGYAGQAGLMGFFDAGSDVRLRNQAH